MWPRVGAPAGRLQRRAVGDRPGCGADGRSAPPRTAYTLCAMTSAHGGSASIAEPTYWWYRARTDLLRTVLEPYVDRDARILDVGSADGPSVGWLRGGTRHASLDLDPRGLGRNGVCGSALSLPFADASFDIVAAFDVIEHCDPEQDALEEVAR